MDNQHQKISGYRDLSQEEVDAMNRFKATERELLAQLAALKRLAPTQASEHSFGLAEDSLRVGFMWAIRGVARPNGE